MKPLTHHFPEANGLFRARPTRGGMEMLATPCAAHLQARALPQSRAPSMILKRTISKAKRHRHHYFKRPSDWLRIVMLGVILLQLAIIAFASNLLGGGELGYVPGTGNMVAGVFSLFILIKIARPKVYHAWLLEAFLQFVLGTIVASNNLLSDLLSFSAAFVVFVALLTVRMWIAATEFRYKGFSSLAAGTGTTIFLLCWLIASRVTPIDIAADVILATDLAIRAISLIMFGLALRK